MVQLLTAMDQVRLSNAPNCLYACTPEEICAILRDLRASNDMRQVVAEISGVHTLSPSIPQASAGPALLSFAQPLISVHEFYVVRSSRCECTGSA